MAVYVLMSFDSDQHAKNWIKIQELYASRRRALSDEEAPPDTDNYEVLAMYKRPTQFCDVMDGKHPGKRVSGFTKGKKYGWWVCASCHKPKKMYADNLLTNSSFGFNLLEKLPEK